MDEVIAAAQDLHKVKLKHTEPWKWISEARRKEILQAKKAVSKARNRLEHLNSQEQRTRLERIRGELEILEACLDDIAKAESGNEKMQAYIRSWQEEVPPEFLMDRLRKIDEALAAFG